MYDVLWREDLLDQLADLYVAVTAPERERMARGVQGLNRRLKDEPLEVGEGRPDGFRVVFTPLLFITFYVDEEGRVVRVSSIRRYGK